MGKKTRGKAGFLPNSASDFFFFEAMKSTLIYRSGRGTLFF
jgi:hypothetical protein